MSKKYDYIIAGGGCAGLSLAVRMANDVFFQDKKILLIEENRKEKDDRTWCFWEAKKGFFEDVVSKKWQNVYFYSNFFSKKLNITPYEYKMIGGLDFYNYCKKILATKANFEFLEAKIEHLGEDNNLPYAQVNGQKIVAEKIFNSIFLQQPDSTNSHNLLQHFKGWYIETATPFFNPNEATLMDFRIEQEGEVRFFYVLPTSETKALIEFTIFSPQLLENEKLYDIEIKKYLSDFLKLSDYKIFHEEFGIIPMTNAKFQESISENIINIGINSGMARPSTGYTFTNIQRQSDELLVLIKTGKSLIRSKSWWKSRHLLYDATILNVMRFNKYSGAKLFARLFKWNSSKQILKFLDADTNFLEEYRIMNTTPIPVFLPVFLKELFKK
jgi:lycopene beta-cyclase